MQHGQADAEQADDLQAREIEHPAEDMEGEARQENQGAQPGLAGVRLAAQGRRLPPEQPQAGGEDEGTVLAGFPRPGGLRQAGGGGRGQGDETDNGRPSRAQQAARVEPPRAALA